MSVLTKKRHLVKKSHRDVVICLDGTLSQERDAAMIELAQAVKREQDGKTRDGRLGASEVMLTRSRVDEIENLMREASVTIRFTAVNYGEYNKHIIQNPPRKGNTVDQNLGFNTGTFFLYVAKKTGQYLVDVAVNDGEEDTLEDIPAEDWDELEEIMTDGDYDKVANAILEINRREGQRGLDFLSPASKATPDSNETSGSPESSASPLVDSGAGSPSNAPSTSTTTTDD